MVFSYDNDNTIGHCANEIHFVTVQATVQKKRLEHLACLRYNDATCGGCRQVVKAPDCGSGIRGFESHHPPQLYYFIRGMC
jgi:hypothetical protein